MKKQRLIVSVIALAGVLLFSTNTLSQDPNFHIYLCFGQSNMEGQGIIEDQDKLSDSRFQVLQAIDCSNLGRTKATWYTAVPPLCQCWSGLSPAAYFGRTMIANLPDSIRVGVINVAIGGCDIRLFDKDIYQDYDSTYTETWFTDKIKAYEGNPYGYLIDLAKLAQEDGVIKGILLHQGETNTGDNLWPSYVKTIYNNMMTDLGLIPESVPLLAGEMVHADQGGVCASMNEIIARLPDTILTAHVISSSGCKDKDDNIHFNSEGYRELGRRYAVKMLSLLGQELSFGQGTGSFQIEAECAWVGDNWNIVADAGASNESYVVIQPGQESMSEAPTDSAGAIYIPFTVDADGNYDVFARLKCLSFDDDSYWIKIDDMPFEMVDELRATGWKWKKLASAELAAGEHTLTIAFREDGAKLDKINISNFLYAPSDMGEEAENLCVPDFTVSGISSATHAKGYALGQNYPNPFSGETNISFEIPHRSYVSLKVITMLGAEIAELGGQEFSSGKHIVAYDTSKLAEGNYFYLMTTDKFTATRKMIVQAD